VLKTFGEKYRKAKIKRSSKRKKQLIDKARNQI